jgi:ABC-2 type transport system permease protein
MNIESNPPRESAGPSPSILTISDTQTLYWSVRRELWENRSIYIAPLIAAAVMLFGFAISVIGLPHRRRAVLLLAPALQRAHIDRPYDIASGMLMMTAIIVGVFYCLDALHGERRDRSILFWKSLPVSDLTTVLSKASIPLLVLPLVTFAVVVALHVDMLLLSTAALVTNGLGPATSSQLPLFQLWLAFLYALIAMALWHAPIYAWLLLISAWARRAAILWALLPPLALAAVERGAFGSSHIGSFLKYRAAGWFSEAFTPQPKHDVLTDPLTRITAGRFLGTPDLWIGLIFASAFLAAAVRLRRDRAPL